MSRHVFKGSEINLMEVLLIEFIVQPQSMILAERFIHKIGQCWEKMGDKKDFFYKTLVMTAYVEPYNKKRLSVRKLFS